MVDVETRCLDGAYKPRQTINDILNECQIIAGWHCRIALRFPCGKRLAHQRGYSNLDCYFALFDLLFMYGHTSFLLLRSEMYVVFVRNIGISRAITLLTIHYLSCKRSGQIVHRV